MTTLERYNLVDDAWSSTLAGRLSAVELLAFLDGFRYEPDHAVWQSIVIALRGLGRIVDDEATDAFQAQVRSLVLPTLERLGEPTDSDSDLTSKLRGLFVGAVGVLGNDIGTAGALSRVVRRGEPRCDHRRPRADRRGDVGGRLDRRRRHLRTDARTLRQRGDPAGATPQPVRADRVRRRGAAAAHVRVRDERRREDPERTVRARPGDRQPSPRRGGVGLRPRSLGRGERAFPDQHHRAHGVGGPAAQHARGGRRRADFFASHPIAQAAKTLEQILERQRVNAALRTRDADRSAAHLTN